MLIVFLPYRKENTIRRLVLGIYLLSSGVTVVKSIFAPEDYPINPIAMLYYTLCTLILLFPFIKYGNLDCKSFIIQKGFFNIFSYILIIFGIVNLIYVIPRIFTLQTLVYNLSDVRNAYYKGIQLVETSGSIIEILANWVMHIQYFSPILAVYYYRKGKIIRTILLCIVSTSPAISNIIIGEREAIIILFSNYIFSYIFWKPSLNNNQIRFIKRASFWMSIPFLLFVLMMTFSRFGEEDNGVGNSIFVYVGEQPYNFSYFFTYLNIDEQMLGGKLNFGIFYSEEDQLSEPINTYISSSKFLNVFAAIPGSFIFDFAYYTIIVCLLISIIFCILISNNKRNHSLGNFIFYIIYYQIIFMGVFYFDFTRKYSIIMSLLVYIVWKIYDYTAKQFPVIV